MRRASIAGLLTLALLAGCDKRPKGVLSQDEMVSLLTDVEMADAYYNTAAPGERIDRRTLLASVMEKHGITQEEMDSTTAYYGRNIDEYALIYEKVGANLRKKTGKEETAVASDDIWPYARFAAFMPNGLGEGITFTFPAEDLERGSALEWGMRLTSTEGADVTLGVEYEGGLASYIKRSATGSKTLKVNLQTDTALQAKRIYGILHVPTASMPVWADSIRLIKTEFDSLNYSKIRQQHRIYPPLPKPLPEKVEGSVVADTVNS